MRTRQTNDALGRGLTAVVADQMELEKVEYLITHMREGRQLNPAVNIPAELSCSRTVDTPEHLMLSEATKRNYGLAFIESP